jgi:hypothetical protein
MIEFFSRFTIKGTVLRNNVFFFDVAKSAKLEKPVLQRKATPF